jgi:hypothetical protein
VRGRERRSIEWEEERGHEREEDGGGGLEVQVNDKMCVRQREVWFMLYSSSGKEKKKTKGRRPPPFPWHFLIILRCPFLRICKNVIPCKAMLVVGRAWIGSSNEKQPASMREPYCHSVQTFRVVN